MNSIELTHYEKFPHVVIIDNDASQTMVNDITDWLIANLGYHGDAYIGPIFNLDIVSNQYYFQNQDHATLFKLTWLEPTKAQRFIIDPPSGWKYGFPREIPESELNRINEWLVENHYPQREIDVFGGKLPYRIWKE